MDYEERSSILKLCSICQLEKQLTEFYQKRDKLDSRCKDCFSDRRKRNKYSKKDYNLRNLYGISLEEYQRLLQLQSGVCAICSKPETLRDRRGVRHLAVDHDHATGDVLGLLCHKCNRALGMFQDDPQIIVKAYNYVTGRKSRLTK